MEEILRRAVWDWYFTDDAFDEVHAACSGEWMGGRRGGTHAGGEHLTSRVELSVNFVCQVVKLMPPELVSDTVRARLQV